LVILERLMFQLSYNNHHHLYPKIDIRNSSIQLTLP